MTYMPIRTHQLGCLAEWQSADCDSALSKRLRSRNEAAARSHHSGFPCIEFSKSTWAKAPHSGMLTFFQGLGDKRLRSRPISRDSGARFSLTLVLNTPSGLMMAYNS